MSIHQIGSELARTTGTTGSLRGPQSGKRSEKAQVVGSERADSIEISAEGRDLAARLAHESEGLSESRATLVRSRIASGFYNDPAVAGKVAERLLESGEL
jgi:hypothetical protein